MSEQEIRQNFSIVRTYNVENLNELLKRRGRIICTDSKLDRLVEIRFLPEKDDAVDVLSEQKVKISSPSCLTFILINPVLPESF